MRLGCGGDAAGFFMEGATGDVNAHLVPGIQVDERHDGQGFTAGSVSVVPNLLLVPSSFTPDPQMDVGGGRVGSSVGHAAEMEQVAAGSSGGEQARLLVESSVKIRLERLLDRKRHVLSSNQLLGTRHPENGEDGLVGVGESHENRSKICTIRMKKSLLEKKAEEFKIRQ